MTTRLKPGALFMSFIDYSDPWEKLIVFVLLLTLSRIFKCKEGEEPLQIIYFVAKHEENLKDIEDTKCN